MSDRLEINLTVKGHVRGDASITDIEDAVAIALSRFKTDYAIYIETALSNSASLHTILAEIDKAREGLIA